MAWEVNNKESEAVLALPGARATGTSSRERRVTVSCGILRGDGGWVVAEDDDGNQHFPFWPHERFAEACATGPWEGEKPVTIDVDEWVMGWLLDLEKDGTRVAVFQTPDDQGVGVAPGRLKSDLEAELGKFEL